MGLVPGLISLDRDSLYQTAKDFVSSCVAEGFEIPTKDFFDMVLNLAVQVSQPTSQNDDAYLNLESSGAASLAYQNAR